MSAQNCPSRVSRKALTLLVMCLSITGAIHAQGTGEITGTVSDPSGAAVSGAKVTATNTATSAERVVNTNDAGVYDLPALAPGNYSMKVEFPGFRTSERKDIELQVAQVDRLDFTMQLGNVSDTIEVTGGAPVLETENATIGTVIENKRIIDLPLNGRNPLQLVSLTPGATTNGPASSQGQQRMGGARNSFSLNVAGQRTSNNHYELDGVENTDPNFNTYLFLPSVDALQEFKVESGTYGAEYGTRPKPGQHDYSQRYQRISWCALRVPPQLRSRREKFLRSGGPDRAIQAQPVRRYSGRPGMDSEGIQRQRQAVLLLRL